MRGMRFDFSTRRYANAHQPGDKGDKGAGGKEVIFHSPPCPMPNAPYFSARGCANGYAQYKCPMPNSKIPVH